MGGAGTAPPRLPVAKGWPVRVALALLKGILLFLLLNLIVYAVIVAREPGKPTPWYWYGTAKILKAYPGWRKEDVKTLLSERGGTLRSSMSRLPNSERYRSGGSS